MRLMATFFIGLLLPAMSLAGGSLLPSELESLLGQMPDVRDFLRSNLRLSDSGYTEVRFGPQFVHLSGGRMGPYIINAKTVKDGKPLVVVLCTTTRFMDQKGKELPGDRIEEAAAIEEKLDGVMLMQGSDLARQSAC